MAKAKKTKKEEVVEIENPIIQLNQKKYEECEWCFQFDEDEPQIFAWTDDDSSKNEDPKVIFTITNVENSYITFQNGNTGKVFKLFARELTNEGIELRNKQKQSFKTIENGSENKEA
jgi:multimeric flavodoxin WrbA